MLNSASFARSVMGRVPWPGTDSSRLPLAVPAMTLMAAPRPVSRLRAACRYG